MDFTRFSGAALDGEDRRQSTRTEWCMCMCVARPVCRRSHRTLMQNPKSCQCRRQLRWLRDRSAVEHEYGPYHT